MYSHRRHTFLFCFVWILERFCRTDDVFMVKNDKWENHILQRPSWLVLEISLWGGRGIEREFLFFTSAGGWLCNYSAACLFFVACGILLDPAHDWEGSRPPLPNPSVIVVNQEESVPVKKEGNRHTGATGKEKENKKKGAGYVEMTGGLLPRRGVCWKFLPSWLLLLLSRSIAWQESGGK